jgi:ribokinase
MNKVFVLGSINMDLVFSVNRMPKLGETIKSNDFFMTPGGKGANQAVACAKQGVFTYMIGSVGNDELSKECKRSLISQGVDCTYVKVIDQTIVGIAGIFVENSDNRIITFAGANKIHDSESIAKILAKNAVKKDFLLTQLEIPLEVVKEILKTAKQLGMNTVLNAAPAQKLTNDLLSLVDILVVNETETEIITEIKPKDETTINLAINKLLDSGVKSVVLTLGEKGSLYSNGYETIALGVYKVDVVDTTAAGDTYIGSLISQLINKSEVKQAMKYATAASALSITKKGAQNSIPKKEEVIDFMIKEGEINE